MPWHPAVQCNKRMSKGGRKCEYFIVFDQSFHSQDDLRGDGHVTTICPRCHKKMKVAVSKLSWVELPE